MGCEARTKLALAGLLIALNTVSHFLPFERAALAPDNYNALVRFIDLDQAQLPSYLLRYPDRPLLHAVLFAQTKIGGDSPGFGLALVYISSSLLLVLAFVFFDQLLRNAFSSFLAAALFCLAPYKLETYHGAIFFNVNMVASLYVLSMVSYMLFQTRGAVGWLICSLIAYAAAIFWYEIGFFTPLIVIGLAFLHHRPNFRYVFLFIAVASVYALYRLGSVYLLDRWDMEAHHASLSAVLPNMIDLLHHLVGWYMARNVFYGFYQFFSIEIPWLIWILAADGALMALGLIALRRVPEPEIDPRLLVISVIMIFVFSAPILLNDQGGVGGRHLTLPSLGIVILGLWGIARKERRWRPAFLGFGFLLLVISQGNAWSQVVASRMNAAFYDTAKERREELRKAARVIVDVSSFAERIPFTWIERDFNVLNTYYGVQAFEEWGLANMVRVATGDPRKPVLVAVKSPKPAANNTVEFTVSNHVGYRSVARLLTHAPAEGTVIIDFKSVYGESFRNGLRAP